MIPYKPNGGINFEQLEREYDWGYRGNMTLTEWCIKAVVDSIVARIERLK